jgi:serine/threonine protein phosphatase PrpC
MPHHHTPSGWPVALTAMRVWPLGMALGLAMSLTAVAWPALASEAPAQANVEPRSENAVEAAAVVASRPTASAPQPASRMTPELSAMPSSAPLPDDAPTPTVAPTAIAAAAATPAAPASQASSAQVAQALKVAQDANAVPKQRDARSGPSKPNKRTQRIEPTLAPEPLHATAQAEPPLPAATAHQAQTHAPQVATVADGADRLTGLSEVAEVTMLAQRPPQAGLHDEAAQPSATHADGAWQPWPHLLLGAAGGALALCCWLAWRHQVRPGTRPAPGGVAQDQAKQRPAATKAQAQAGAMGSAQAIESAPAPIQALPPTSAPNPTQHHTSPITPVAPIATPSHPVPGPNFAVRRAALEQPAYLQMSTAEWVTLAKKLDASNAQPDDVLRELMALGLPVEPLDAVHAGLVSITGNSRKHWNEDSGLAFRSNWIRGPYEVLMVFDGMGGMPDGKLASKLAALFLAVELHRMQDTVPSDVLAHMRAAFDRTDLRFKKASRALYQGLVNPDALRSTAIVLLANQTHYHLAYQGDGHAKVRRADGTLISLMTAHKGAASNMVRCSLGPQADGDVAVARHARLPGDVVCLASDGFDPVDPQGLLDCLDAYGAHHPMQTVVAHLTEDCRLQEDDRGSVCDDNMTLAALRTPIKAALQAPHASQPCCPPLRNSEPLALNHLPRRSP